MRQLNFDLKTLQARHREGAFLTRRDRSYALAQAADMLHALGFRRLRATGLIPEPIVVEAVRGMRLGVELPFQALDLAWVPCPAPGAGV